MFSNLLKAITNIFQPKPQYKTAEQLNLPKNIKLGSTGQQNIKQAAQPLQNKSGTSYVSQPKNTNTNLSIAGTPPANSYVSNAPSSSSSERQLISIPPLSVPTKSAGPTSPFSFDSALRSIAGRNTNLVKDVASGNIGSAAIGALGKIAGLGEMGASELVRGVVNVQDLAGIPRMGIIDEKKYPKEKGLSEASDGRGRQVKGAITDSSSLYGNNVSRDPRFIYDKNGNPIASNANYKNPLDIRNLDKVQGDISGKAKGYVDDPTLGVKDTNLDDTYGIFDDPYEEILNEYYAGNLSDEEALNRRNELELKQANAIYDKLKADSDALIPEYVRESDEEIKRLNDDLADAKGEGELQKTNIENTYGNLIRRSRQNTNQSTVNLKNIFSALGTADSSAFMDQARKLEQGGLETESGYEKESASKRLAIDTDLTKLERNTKDKISSAIATRNAKIDAVRRNTAYSEQERKSKIFEINQNLSDSIDSLKDDYRSVKAQLLLSKQDALDTRKNIYAQGEVDSNLLDKQYQLQGQLVGNAQAGATEDEFAELARPYSSMYKSSIANRLKSQYLNLADLIDGVSQGRRSVDELRKALGALSVA